MNRNNHTTQQQLGILEKDGNMPQCGCLMHDKRTNPIPSMNCLQTKNPSNINMSSDRETKCFQKYIPQEKAY